MKLLSLACLFCLATLGACMSASLQEALDALNDHLDGKSTDMDSQVADNNKELTEEELKAAGINTDGKNTQFMLDLDEQGNDAKSDETNIPDDIREAEEGRSDIAVTELYSEGQMDEDKVKEPVIIDQAGEGDKEPVENLGPNMLAMNPNIPDAFAASDREQQNPNFANADNNADAEEPVPDDDDDDFNFDDMVANEQGAQNKETQGGGEDRTTDEDADEPVANNEDFNFPDMGADAQGMQKNVPQGNGEDRATGEGAQSADSQGTAGDFVLNSYDREDGRLSNSSLKKTDKIGTEDYLDDMTRTYRLPNPCSSSPCLQGTCLNVGTSYLCQCYEGYTGTNCDHEIEQTASIDTSLRESPAVPKISIGKPYPIPYPYPHPHAEPCHCGTPCCDMRKTKISLRYNKPYVINNLFDGVVVEQKPTAWNSKAECSRTALIKVRFERITPEPVPDLCISNKYCGKRMLRIDLELSKYRSSGDRRMFNIGDSATNDGWGGDAGTQNYDAEIDGRANSFHVYGSDHCENREPFVFPDALASNVKRITIWVSQGYMRVKNYQGCDEEMCMPDCLFALNGQNDTTINQDIYIALNRVVSGRYDRNGWGVCSAVLSWACPFPRDSPDNQCDIQ